jgi:hypothetical protein
MNPALQRLTEKFELGVSSEKKLFPGAFLWALRQKGFVESAFRIQRAGYGNLKQPLRLSGETEQPALGDSICFITLHAL